MNIIKSLKSITIISTLFVFAGCGDELKTVEWYKAHEKERQEKIMKCNSEFKDNTDCNNAKKAEISIIDEEFIAKRKKSTE